MDANQMAGQRGHRRKETLGKDLPATSIFLNLSSLNRNVSRHDITRSDASPSFDYLHKIDEEEFEHRPYCLVPNNSPIPQTHKQIDMESDESLSESDDHNYEILISESSCDSSDDYTETNDNDSNIEKINPEELVSLVGNSKFYVPRLTLANEKQINVCKKNGDSNSCAKNKMCCQMSAVAIDSCLSLPSYVPADQKPLFKQQLFDNRVKLLEQQLKENGSPLKCQIQSSSNCIAMQRKNFFTNMLRLNDSDYNGDNDSINYQLSQKSIGEMDEKIYSNDNLVKASDTDTDTKIERVEIAKALAKTTELTSTTQIKQRLAARKLEIELDNIFSEYDNENKNNYTATVHSDLKHQQQFTNKIFTQQQQQPIALTSSICASITADKINDIDAMTSAFDNTITEIPRELLTYLIRMGSFNSTPKINNVDSQDNNFELPENLNGDNLLSYVRQLRDGYNEWPLLRRYFMKLPSISSSASSASYHELANNLNHLNIHNDDGAYANVKAHCLRIFQWNLLSQTLGQYNDGFIRCPDKALTWQHRKFLIVEEILQNVPDIICLQEVDHFKFLQKILNSQNYEGVFFPKPDSPCLYIKENNGPDGCAIFFKRDKYELKNIDTHILEVWRVQSNQVAIAVNLLIKAINCEICVCTTHLKARHGTLLAKLRNEQGRDLLRHVKRFAGDRPVILCGDFNAEPIEPVYNTILTCDFLNLSSAYADIYKENDEYCNVDAHDDQNENYCKKYDKVQKSIRNEPPYTTWKIRENGEECHTIDYIFYSSNQFKVRNCLEFPHENEIGKDRAPNYQYPSDHFSLVCDLELSTSTQ